MLAARGAAAAARRCPCRRTLRSNTARRLLIRLSSSGAWGGLHGGSRPPQPPEPPEPPRARRLEGGDPYQWMEDRSDEVLEHLNVSFQKV